MISIIGSLSCEDLSLVSPFAFVCGGGPHLIPARGSPGLGGVSMGKGLLVIKIIAWVNVVAVLLWFAFKFFRRRL